MRGHMHSRTVKLATLLVIFISALALASDLCAQTGAKATLSQRLSKLSAFIDTQAAVIEPAISTQELTAGRNNADYSFGAIRRREGTMASPESMGAAEANGVLMEQQSRILQQNEAELKAFSTVLKTTLSEMPAWSDEQTMEKLSSIKVPSYVQTVLVLTPNGDPSSLPPHLELSPSEFGNLGDYVVGPGAAVTVDYPSVAEVGYAWEGQGHSALCTGTLISPDSLLTAAHCFCDFAGSKNAAACMRANYQRALEDLSTTDLKYVTIFFSDKGPVVPKQIIIDPDYNWPRDDLAIIKLSEPILDVMPAPLNDSGPLPVNTYATIVGFGVHGTLDANGKPVTMDPVADSQGLKLWATTRTAVCDASRANEGLICWNFQSHPFDQVLGSTCHGDSGGPLFAKINGLWKLVGVTSGGADSCAPDSSIQSFDIDVSEHLAWIRKEAAPAVNAVFPLTSTEFIANPKARALDAPYHKFVKQVDRWDAAFFIPSGLTHLCVSINSTPVFSNLGLELFAPGATTPTCSIAGDDSFESCAAKVSNAGTWRISVSGSTPEESQLVAAVSR